MPSGKTKIPSELGKEIDVDSLLEAASVETIRQYAEPVNKTGNFVPGDVIRIDFPSYSSNFKDSFLSFTGFTTASSTPGAGAIDRFPFPIGCIFSRVKVLLGTTVLADIDDYDVLHGLLSNLWSADLVTGQAITNLALEGEYGGATRNVDSLAGGQLYQVKLFVDILRQYIPLDFCNGRLRLELTLGSADRVLESDAAAPDGTYQIDNVRYYYEQWKLPSELSNVVRSEVQSGRFMIPYRSFSHLQNSNLGANTTATIEVNIRKQWINSLVIVTREGANVVDRTVYNKQTVYPNNVNNITRLSLKIQGRTIPLDENDQLGQDSTAKNHYMLMKDFISCYNKFSDVRGRSYNAIAAQFWNTAGSRRMVYAFDLRKDKRNDVNLWYNGENTSSGNTQFQLRQTYSAAFTAGYQDFFAEYESFLTLRPSSWVLVE